MAHSVFFYREPPPVLPLRAVSLFKIEACQHTLQNAVGACGSSAAPKALSCVPVGVSQRALVGGARVRWLRKREERLRNHRMGCLPVVNRMLSRPNEGAGDSFASLARCCPARPASPGSSTACRQFRALTLWNSLAASR